MSASSQQETILIVDDNEQYRNMIFEILELGGFQVLQAGDGEEALKLCIQSQGKIDLIFTDIVMPRMDGMLLVEKVLERFPHVKVIYTSGYSQDRTFQQATDTGDVHFLEKPFPPELLLEKIQTVLRGKTPGSC